MAAVVARRYWCCSLQAERLMKKLGMQGVRRGKKCWATISDDLLDRPTDKVNRQFVAARLNQLWVSDITFVATWIGFVYAAFIDYTEQRKQTLTPPSAVLEILMTMPWRRDHQWFVQDRSHTASRSLT